VTAVSELDRRLVDWMNETASSPPPAGRFEQAVATTTGRRPRPRWLASVGSDWVEAAPGWRIEWGQRRLRWEVAVAVALLIAAFVGLALVAGPGNRAPTSAPLPAASALAPGTQFLANPYTDSNGIRDCLRGCADYTRIVFTVPSGWATREGLVGKHLGQADEVAFSAWTVDQVYDDPCHWRSSTLSLLDIERHTDGPTGALIPAPQGGGLANQRLRGPLPRALTQVTLGGQRALRVDLSVPNDLSACDDGEFRSWTEWDVADGANAHHAPGQLDTVYMVDVDRRPLVIDASHMPATSAADLAELDAIFASMFIERTGVPAPSAGSSLSGASPARRPGAPRS